MKSRKVIATPSGHLKPRNQTRSRRILFGVSVALAIAFFSREWTSVNLSSLISIWRTSAGASTTPSDSAASQPASDSEQRKNSWHRAKIPSFKPRCHDPDKPACHVTGEQPEAHREASLRRTRDHRPPPPDPEEDDYGNDLGQEVRPVSPRDALRKSILDRLRTRGSRVRSRSRSSSDSHVIRSIHRRKQLGPRVRRLEPIIFPIRVQNQPLNPYLSMTPSPEWTAWVRRAMKNGTLMWQQMEQAGMTARVSPKDLFLAREPGAGGLSPGPTLFVGIFSSPLHVSRRTACRDTWLDDPAVRNGSVVYRFFVGLHRRVNVSESLFVEREQHGDIEILPFMDSYYLISYKTAAIADFAARRLNVTYVMKTDDDVIVRFDALLPSLRSTNRTQGLLYGSLVKRSVAVRNQQSKWHCSYKEWPTRYYPMWAHGAGYIFTMDIAKYVSQEMTMGSLKFFKLEDVCFAIWVNNLFLEKKEIWYMDDRSIIFDGCQTNYTIAHYQSPDNLRCLFNKLKAGDATCCQSQEERLL